MYVRMLAQINYLGRLGLVGLIYNDSLTAKHGLFDESTAMTLMSNDAESATSCADLLHESWSQVFELCIGMYMLAGKLGWACILRPLVILCKLLHNCQSRRVTLSLRHNNDFDVYAVLIITRHLANGRIHHCKYHKPTNVL